MNRGEMMSWESYPADDRLCLAMLNAALVAVPEEKEGGTKGAASCRDDQTSEALTHHDVALQLTLLRILYPDPIGRLVSPYYSLRGKKEENKRNQASSLRKRVSSVFLKRDDGGSDAGGEKDNHCGFCLVKGIPASPTTRTTLVGDDHCVSLAWGELRETLVQQLSYHQADGRKKLSSTAIAGGGLADAMKENSRVGASSPPTVLASGIAWQLRHSEFEDVLASLCPLPAVHRHPWLTDVLQQGRSRGEAHLTVAGVLGAVPHLMYFWTLCLEQLTATGEANCSQWFGAAVSALCWGERWDEVFFFLKRQSTRKATVREPILAHALRSEKGRQLLPRLLAYGADVHSANFEERTPVMVAASLGFIDELKFLVHSAQGSIDSVDSWQVPPLVLAVEQGKTKAVRTLLALGANPNARGHGGRTALYHAAVLGDSTIGDMLIKAGANVNATTKGHRRTALHAVVASLSSRALALLRLLLSVPSLKKNPIDDDGVSPLHEAIRRGNVPAVSTLLCCEGVDPNATDELLPQQHLPTPQQRSSTYTSAYLPRSSRQNSSLTNGSLTAQGRSLVGSERAAGEERGGASVASSFGFPLGDRQNAPLHTGSPCASGSPLFFFSSQKSEATADSENPSATAARLENASVSSTGSESYTNSPSGSPTMSPIWGSPAGSFASSSAIGGGGSSSPLPLASSTCLKRITPLHFAAQFCKTEEHLEVLSKLLEQGAQLEARDAVERTPLMYAVKHKRASALSFLISRGANVNVGDRHGKSALSVAASNNFRQGIELMHAAGGDLEAEDRLCWRAVHHAAHALAVDALECLLSLKADPNANDIASHTPLLLALTSCGFDSALPLKETVSLLLKGGADPNIPNEQGMSPLAAAVDRPEEDTPLVSLLLAHGAEVQSSVSSSSTSSAGPSPPSLYNPMVLAKERRHEKVVGLLRGAYEEQLRHNKRRTSSARKNGRCVLQ